MSFPRALPVGDAALTVELGDALSPATNARVLALDRDLAQAPFEGFREAVPSHRSLLVLFDPAAIRFAALASALVARAARGGAAPAPGRLHEVEVVYGGESGPDLALLARERGLSERDLVRLHAGGPYVAFMLGFTPGFAYLGLLPEALESPRHATPRVRVPAGSVAVAGRQTGIYPVASPGGWRLIGRTSRRLFDPFRAEPALLAPGDRVRFVPVAELPPPEPASTVPSLPAAPIVEVLEPGLLTTVQDAGRAGYRRVGVSAAGPMDARAHAVANRAVGNPAGAAALECTMTGPALAFLAPLRFAVAGADLGAVLERADLGAWPVPPGAGVLARPGNVLRFTGRRSGCRAYVALQGGIDVPAVLGSRSTELLSGFGGLRGPRARRRRPPGGPPRRRRGRGCPGGRQPTARHVTSASIRVVLGPQADHFDAATTARFLASPWRVSPTSDRVGCRLEGEPLRHAGPAEILSDGMVPGSIQVPPDGRPIVITADGPTTGGYPKIATVLTADLPLLAQLVPGEGELRFEAVRSRGPVAQDPVDRQRAADVETLSVGEAELRAGAGLAGRLYALRHRLHEQLAREPEERVEEPALRGGRLVEPGHEASVELQVVWRRLRQLEEPRLARPEVVVGQSDVALEQQLPQLRDRGRAGEDALVDLEGEVDLGGDLPQLLERLEQPRPGHLDRVRVQEDRGEVGPVGGELDGLPPEEAAQLGGGPDALRDAEQLQRALRQLRVAATAERLVGGHRAPGEQHDGLEDHGHLAVAQELAHLARALRKTVGQVGPLHRHRRGPLVRRGGGRLVLHVRPAEAELEVGEVQDVPVPERSVFHEGPVQEGAVLAAEVAQPQAGTQRVDLRVLLGDGVRGQDQLEPVAAADAEGQRADPDAPKRAALGEGLQVPPRLADRRTALAAPRFVAHAHALVMP